MVKILLKHPRIDVNMTLSDENKEENTFLINALKELKVDRKLLLFSTKFFI